MVKHMTITRLAGGDIEYVRVRKQEDGTNDLMIVFKGDTTGVIIPVSDMDADYIKEHLDDARGS